MSHYSINFCHHDMTYPYEAAMAVIDGAVCARAHTIFACCASAASVT